MGIALDRDEDIVVHVSDVLGVVSQIVAVAIDVSLAFAGDFDNGASDEPARTGVVSLKIFITTVGLRFAFCVGGDCD